MFRKMDFSILVPHWVILIQGAGFGVSEILGGVGRLFVALLRNLRRAQSRATSESGYLEAQWSSRSTEAGCSGRAVAHG